MVKLTGKLTDLQLDIKRFYLEGLKIKWDCPECKSKNIHDLGSEYLSYPVANQQSKITIYCEECDTTFEIKSQLNVSLKILSNEVEVDE